MFKLTQRNKLSVTVKGLIDSFFQSPIQWEDRLKGRKWINIQGTFEPQRWGRWDSNSCWVLSAINSIEDQCELLELDGLFSDEAKNFFNSNGYKDEVGDWSFSELFIEKLGKQGINGGTSPLAWQLIYKHGLIPRKMLNYSLERAFKCNTEEEFIADYFNPNEITQEMIDLGRQSKKYLTVAYQRIGKAWITPSDEILANALQFAPVCIGIPVPTIQTNWNNTYVKYDGNAVLAHETELQEILTDGTRCISDQYQPDEKQLSPNYPIFQAHQGIVYSLSKPLNAPPAPVLTPEQSFLQKLWTSIYNWFNGVPNPFPIG